VATEANFGFPQSRRLKLKAEFERIRTEGQSARGIFLTLNVLKGVDGPARAGFVTSRRVGNAVLRNRTRRRLREIFRKNQHTLADNVWILTIASPRAARASYAALEDDWLRLAQRASILPL
jgi:ribonuclease P protein component